MRTASAVLLMSLLLLLLDNPESNPCHMNAARQQFKNPRLSPPEHSTSIPDSSSSADSRLTMAFSRTISRAPTASTAAVTTGMPAGTRRSAARPMVGAPQAQRGVRARWKLLSPGQNKCLLFQPGGLVGRHRPRHTHLRLSPLDWLAPQQRGFSAPHALTDGYHRYKDDEADDQGLLSTEIRSDHHTEDCDDARKGKQAQPSRDAAQHLHNATAAAQGLGSFPPPLLLLVLLLVEAIAGGGSAAHSCGFEIALQGRVLALAIEHRHGRSRAASPKS